jgi:Domain of unknown function (DUF4398)
MKVIIGGALAILLAACAGGAEKPTAELTRANTLIEQAEERDAQEFAGEDLERARQKLQQAQAAAEEGDNELAQRLAAEAAVDAEFASARATSAEAKKAAEELRKSNETLRREAAPEPAPPSG